MTSYSELTDKATTSILDAVKPVEELTKTVIGAVDGVASKLPSLPASPALPTASEVLTANYSAVERLFAAQKDFLLGLAAATPAVVTVVPKQAEAKVSAKV